MRSKGLAKKWRSDYLTFKDGKDGMRILFPLLFLLGGCSFVFAEDWPKWRGIQGNGTWDGPVIAKDLKDEGLAEGLESLRTSGLFRSHCKRKSRISDGSSAYEKWKRRRNGFFVSTGRTARKIWEFIYPAEYKKLDYDKGPRASLTLEEDRVFGLGAMGHAFCLDIKSGKRFG